jgi:hypothetical protein
MPRGRHENAPSSRRRRLALRPVLHIGRAAARYCCLWRSPGSSRQASPASRSRHSWAGRTAPSPSPAAEDGGDDVGRDAPGNDGARGGHAAPGGHAGGAGSAAPAGAAAPAGHASRRRERRRAQRPGLQADAGRRLLRSAALCSSRPWPS